MAEKHDEVIPYPHKEEDFKRNIMIAVDESHYTKYAVEWSLENLIHPESDQVILVNVRPFPSTALSLTSSTEFIVRYEEELKFKSHQLLKSYQEKLKKCMLRLISAVGDPREKLVDLVDEFHVDILVVGNRGVSIAKKALLGSVSDYCIHYANSAVMIPKAEDLEDLKRKDEELEKVARKEE